MLFVSSKYQRLNSKIHYRTNNQNINMIKIEREMNEEHYQGGHEIGRYYSCS